MDEPSMVEPELTSAPPSHKKRRLPVWLRWVVGIPLALCAVVLITFPPRQAATLNGWTPGCPELEAEEWREAILSKNELAGIDRYEVFEAWPNWNFGEGRMSIYSDIVMGDGRRAELWLAVPAEGIEPRAEITTTRSWMYTLNRGDFGVDRAADPFWMTWDETDSGGDYKLIRYDLKTLEQIANIALPIPVPANHKLDFIVPVSLAGVADDGTWWLVTNYWSKHLVSGLQVDQIRAWQFDPRTGVFGSSAQLTLPTQQPNGTPFQWDELGILAESGIAVSIVENPPWVMQLIDWPTGSTTPPTLRMLQKHSTPPLAQNPPVSKGWKAGWFEWWLSAGAGTTEAAAIRMPYRKFNLPKQAREALSAPRMQQVPPGALPSLRWAYNYTEQTQSQLEWYFDRQIVKYQPFYMETTWNGKSPLEPGFESSLRATLDHLRWIEWPYEHTQPLRVAALDADSFLIVQMVVTEKTKDPLIRQGIMRFGLMEKPNSTITWLGYLPLPAEFAKYRYRAQFHWVQEADGWRVMLSAVRDEEDITQRGFWWTRVAYPAGWSPPAQQGTSVELQYEPVRLDPAAENP